jgi:D-alanyl-lipoteichoic acid acyltransferase DltB (MBOAT superfamily)
MLFNSYIFVLVFLPVTLLLFYVLGRLGQARAAILTVVIASLFFYGWWNPIYVPLIIMSILVNYLVGSGIGRANNGSSGGGAKTLLIVGIAFNLGLLGYFKYANFFIDSVNVATGSEFTLAPIALPLAISFFSFQQIAYLVDVYQRKAEEYDLLRYALFVTFFPQLIAGPIVHHKEMMPQFSNAALARFCTKNFSVGSAIFFVGLFKKVILADSVAPFASNVFNGAEMGSAIGFSEAWLGALAYSCQIYFDFSGYSDMAIGLGRMFGIQLPLNFNSPYKASGIIDFWGRWHITLSRFLRDYLYIPLGGNRLGSTRRYTNLMIVMLLGGLWHGAGWNFVIWGGLHGFYLILNHGWRTWRGERRSRSQAAIFFSSVLTFLAVTVAWVFFRADTYAGAMHIISAMAGGAGVTLPQWSANLPGIGGLIAALPLSLETAYWAPLDAVLWVMGLLVMAWLLPNTQQLMCAFMDPQRYAIEPLRRWSSWLSWQPDFKSAVVIAAVTVIALVSLGRPSEFIYYQF